MYHELFAKSGLSLDRLRTFCLVAQAGGVTKAAGGDPNRQSQYSRQVKELEAFFGVELFTRKGRGVVLSPAGKDLAGLAHRFLLGLSDYAAERREETVELSLGAGESLLRWALMPVYGEIRREFPKVLLRLSNLRTKEIVDQLVTGELDLGLVRADAVPKTLDHVRCLKVPFQLFFNSAVRAEKRKATAQPLPLAVLDGDGAYRQSIDELCEKRPGEFQVVLSCSSFPTIVDAMLKAGHAAVLPSLAWGELKGKGFKARDLPELKGMERDYALAWNPRMKEIRSVVAKAVELFPKVIHG